MGIRKKTRSKLSNSAKKGKVTVNRYFKQFADNAVVQVNIQPSVHSGIPHHRFQGKTGKVVGKQGTIYKVEMAKEKKIVLAHSAHLKELKMVETPK